MLLYHIMNIRFPYSINMVLICINFRSSEIQIILSYSIINLVSELVQIIPKKTLAATNKP